MTIKRMVADRFGLISGIENRIQSKSLVGMNREAKTLANELPASFSSLRKGTKVRESSTGKVGRITEPSGVEYDNGNKFYFVQFNGEDVPRLICKSEFRII